MLARWTGQVKHFSLQLSNAVSGINSGWQSMEGKHCQEWEGETKKIHNWEKGIRSEECTVSIKMHLLPPTVAWSAVWWWYYLIGCAWDRNAELSHWSCIERVKGNCHVNHFGFLLKAKFWHANSMCKYFNCSTLLIFLLNNEAFLSDLYCRCTVS